MFNIKDFAASINTNGVLKNNKYLAIITLGNDHYLNGVVNQADSRLFTVRCDTVQLPGVALASADGPPRLGYGPVEKHMYNANFEDITLTFIVDANSRIHRMLYNWVNVIVNFQSQGGKQLFKSTGPMKSSAYEVGYRSRYAAELEIIVYRDTGKNNAHEKIMTYKLYNAYPMAFPSSGMNWQDGEVLKLTIPFAYTDYSVEYNEYSDVGTAPPPAVETGQVQQEVATGITPGPTPTSRFIVPFINQDFT